MFRFSPPSSRPHRSLLRLAAALAIAGAWWSAEATAQQRPQGPAAFSGAVGIVVDSIHGGPLPKAVVRVTGTGRQAVTDAKGYYRIDSVPPGTYRLSLHHPLLDTLGMVIETQPIDFESGRFPVVPIGTPSGDAMLDIACPPVIPNREGPAALLGVIRDPDTGVPAIGATVALTWLEIRASREAGVRRLRRTRTAVVDSAGNYAICGLPVDMNATVWAAHDGASTAGVEIEIDETAFLALRSLSLGASETVTDTAPDGTVRTLRRGPATLRGRVTGTDGAGIAGARVEVPGTPVEATTAPSGAFTLDHLPAGTQAVVIRAIGFSPERRVVELSAKTPQEVTVGLSTVQVLATLESEVAASGLDRVGFTDRQRSGFGRYLTREEIEQRNPMVITDLFTMIPGVRMGWDDSGNEVIQSSRASPGETGCTAVFVDRFPFYPPTPDQLVQHLNFMVRPENIWAMEVYQPSQVPGEFTSAGGQRCLTVVIWTRMAIGETQTP